MTEPTNPGIPQIVKLWQDEEVEARLWIQALILMPQNAEWGPKFYTSLASLMNKVLATKYHMKNIERVEREERHKGLKIFKKPNATLWESYQLVYETEAFFFQVKSSLDIATGTLRKALDSASMPYTFGDNGTKVVNCLRRYLDKKHGVHRPAVERLISTILEDQKTWIRTSVEIRDQLSHHQSMQGVIFRPLYDPRGRLMDVIKPKLLGRSFSEVTQQIYENNLQFLQDFVSLTIIMKIGLGVDLGPPDQNFIRRMVRTEEQIQFVKYGLAMTGTIISPPK